jgi:hypothetical protein
MPYVRSQDFFATRKTDFRPRMLGPVNAVADKIATLVADEVRGVDTEILRCAYLTLSFRTAHPEAL